MSPASIGAEILTCWRTIVPTLAAVMRVVAMLAFVRVLSPPKVGQSALLPAVAVAAAPRGAPLSAAWLPRRWPVVMETVATIAVIRKQIERSFFIEVLSCASYFPMIFISGAGRHTS